MARAYNKKPDGGKWTRLEINRRWRDNHPGKQRKLAKSWRKRNLARYHATEKRRRGRRGEIYKDRRIARKYGLTSQEYKFLEMEQFGLCAICFIPPDPGTRLAVDHSHDSGKIRGLLCNKCNHGLGRFLDNPVLLDRAKSYLEGTNADAAVQVERWQ